MALAAASNASGSGGRELAELQFTASWQRGLAPQSDRLRTHAAVVSQLQTLLNYNFPQAYSEASEWADGLRRVASAPALSQKGVPPMPPPSPIGGSPSIARRRKPVIEDRALSTLSQNRGLQRSASALGPFVEPLSPSRRSHAVTLPARQQKK
eukprot:TRINITY_DN37009_c0_g1_i1.p1 TRINITY_DN37009_c0_g1~~TRINITY_DN37009_c0_g1_i1.p1  ORF type:complete len:168 (-),score=22.07 TRINITY_DN37009_c0_g1_i1:91-549(-)